MLLLPVTAEAQLKSPEYLEVAQVSILKADLQQVTAVADLKFYNPNGYALTLKDCDIDAWVNQQYIGKVTVDEKIKVPARDTFLLPVTLTVPVARIFSNALDLLSTSSMPLKLDGSIKAGKAGIFIRIPVKYEGALDL